MTTPSSRPERAAGFEHRLGAVQAALIGDLGNGMNPGRDGLISRITRAALSSDGSDLAAAIARMAARQGAPGVPADLAFLCDWAGFWAFGPGWSPPLRAYRPSRAEWGADQDWMDWRRACEHSVRRALAGRVPLALDAGLWWVEARINGVAGRFILDTGAPSSVLTPQFALRAGIAPAGPERPIYDGAGLSAPLCPARADRVEVGDWQGTALPLAILALAAPLAADGIFAPFDLFGHAGLTIDGPSGELRVGARHAPRGSCLVPLFWSEGQASVRARFGDTLLWLLLDTGAGALVLVADAAARVCIAGDGTGFRSHTALGAVGIDRAGRCQFVLDPSLAPLDLPVYLKGRPPGPPRPLPRLVDGYLGMSFFRTHVVHFPARRGRVAISRVQPEVPQ